MKKLLQVGDMVRIYSGYGTSRGKIIELGNMGGVDYLHVKRRDGSVVDAHPKQCRKLKPKPKPEVKKEPRRLIASFNLIGEVAGVGRPLAKEATLGTHYRDNDVADFIELLPGSTLITRDKLASAWGIVMKSYVGVNEPGVSRAFDDFALALGLGEG